MARVAGLASREDVLGNFTQRVARIGDAVKLSVDVGTLGTLAISRFSSDEATRCKTDALVLDRGRAGFLRLFGFGLLRGHGGLEDLVAGLQVADRGVERNRGGLHFGGGVHGFGGFGGRFGCTGVGRCRRFARFIDLAVAFGELLLQRLELLLLRLQGLAELLKLGRDGRIGLLSLFGRLGLRRVSRIGRLRIGVLPRIGNSSSGNEEQR